MTHTIEFDREDLQVLIKALESLTRDINAEDYEIDIAGMLMNHFCFLLDLENREEVPYVCFDTEEEFDEFFDRYLKEGE